MIFSQIWLLKEIMCTRKNILYLNSDVFDWKDGFNCAREGSDFHKVCVKAL